jgi:hypothetical protein
MKRAVERIVLWALIGATVACFWALFAAVMGPRFNFGHWTVVAITVPASRFGRGRPVSYYEVMLLNAVLYGLVGFALEPLFHRRLPIERSRNHLNHVL